MSKSITIKLTPAQARALLWAVDTFESSYEGYGDAEANRAIRTLSAPCATIAGGLYLNTTPTN